MKRFLFFLLFFPFFSFAEVISENSYYLDENIAAAVCNAAYPSTSESCRRYGSGVNKWSYFEGYSDTGSFRRDNYDCSATAADNYQHPCTDYNFYWVNECPAGTTADPQNPTHCVEDDGCEYGSLAPDCAVDCPALEYTYYLNGVARRGRIGAGKVGHGQSCPQPSYPSGSDSGCVGSPGTCPDYPTATNEGEQVTSSETNSETDGDTTTETTTSSSQSGQSSTDGLNSGSGDGSAVASDGSSNFTPGQDGVSTDTVDVGDTTYALCDHGGVVDGTIGCDYTPPSCSAGQIITSYACIDRPDADPEDAPPTTTTTTTTDPVTGDTTSTTTSTTGTSGGESDDGETSNNSASASGDCAVPPSCQDEQPALCAILQQHWSFECNQQETVSDVLDCQEAFECDGNPIHCKILELQHRTSFDLYCTQDIDDVLTSDGSQTLSDYMSDNTQTIDATSLVDPIINQSSFLPDSNCPSMPPFTVLGVQISYDTTPVCDFAGYVRFIIISLALIAALRIVYGAFGRA